MVAPHGARHHCEHGDPETFQTTLSARQPRSPSESLWKSSNPARRSLRLSGMSEHRLYNSCQTHTDAAVKKSCFVAVCFFWILQSEVDFSAPVLSVASLRVLKPVIQTASSIIYSLLSALCWVIPRVAEETNTMQMFAQFTPFKCSTKTR